MARFAAPLMLLGLLLCASLVSASPFNQEEELRNSECDNGCFFGSFPGGSCTNDAACMCDQQKYREAYFCCMGTKCATKVLPDSIERQTVECLARNMPFTFDAEAVCGIKLTTSSTITASATTSAAASGTQSSAASVSTTASFSAPYRPQSSALSSTGTSAGTSAASATGSQTSSGVPTPTATTNSASPERIMSNGVVILVAVSGMLLW